MTIPLLLVFSSSKSPDRGGWELDRVPEILFRVEKDPPQGEDGNHPAWGKRLLTTHHFSRSSLFQPKSQASMEAAPGPTRASAAPIAASKIS